MAFPVAEPDQDRQLMTVAPHPAAHRRSLSPPAARRNMNATPARGRQSSCDRRPTPRSRASSPSKTANAAASDEDTSALPAANASLASRPRSSNPHRRARQTLPLPPRGFLLGRLSSAGPGPSPTLAKGRRPKPFAIAVGPGSLGYPPECWCRGPSDVGRRRRSAR